MGIRPEVAYAQAAKETAFGRFGGVVTRDHHNWCGLKTTKGGSNSDPYAHAKFPDDEVGVLAHLQHLALYAGVEVTGRIVDPRHFSSIEGTAPTVEALGGKWAPAADYGQSIVRDYLAGLLETKVSTPPVEKPVEHWAQQDHDELRAAGYLLNDHSGTFDEPATKGIVFALVNRLRKTIEHQPPADTPVPEVPTEPKPPAEPEQPTDPEPPPAEPTSYPPCWLAGPDEPCVRDDGSIDWKGQTPPPGVEEPEQPAPPWEETIERVKNATVYVTVKHMNYGTGWHIGNGYIVTARHNVYNQDEIIIWMRDTGTKDYIARKVAIHPEVDLAIYRLVGSEPKEALQLAEKPVTKGLEVGLVGHQKGQNWVHKCGQVTHITDNNRPWAFSARYEPDSEKGNSGGPVFDQYGKVYGVHIGYGSCATNLQLYRDWIAEHTR
ncbi:MAG: trypsin-like peptidase domain-containing protein, partial [Brevibacillus sp.]|nr:trypsin-like peptidase domain-containing protein [Brevibacillus sp.]